MAGEVLVTFEDVAIYFSLDEWVMLTVWQRDLYREVMEDNFELVASLESRRPPKPELICKMERGQEPYAFDVPGQEDDTAFGAPLSAAWSPNVPEPAIKEDFGGHWNPLASLESSDFGVGVRPVKACPGWTASKPPAVRSSAVQGPREWEEGGGSLRRASLDRVMLQICECGRSFEDTKSLHDHRALHQEEGGPFVCRVCGKPFRYRLNLLTHKKYRGKKRYSCAPCGLQFCLKGDMLRHRAGHAAAGLHPSFGHKGHPPAPKAERGGDRAHKCPTCGTAFASEVQLLWHQLSHPEEQPFLYAKCGQSFSWKESLQVHQRAHTQDRGHSCHVCGKTFSRHGNLLTHQQLHTGELPFPARSVSAVSPVRPTSWRTAGSTSKGGPWPARDVAVASDSGMGSWSTWSLTAQRRDPEPRRCSD